MERRDFGLFGPGLVVVETKIGAASLIALQARPALRPDDPPPKLCIGPAIAVADSKDLLQTSPHRFLGQPKRAQHPGELRAGLLDSQS